MNAALAKLTSAALALLLPVSSFAATAAPAANTVRFGGNSFRFDGLPPAIPTVSGAPLSLTASDGSGLKLTRLEARAVVEGPLAFTELHLSFENPRDRVIEGQFKITLPDGASVSRFAMKQDRGWQEGEMVEKQKARLAYEDFLHRRQDPALLEQGAGNEFSARVFPIPARGAKDLIISYSQELTGSKTPYVLPLRGLPELGELDAQVSAGGRTLAQLKKSHYVPAADFEAIVPASNGSVRQGDLAVVRIQPVVASRPDEIASLLVLFDTSASRALGFSSQLRLLERLMQGLSRGAGQDTPVTVAAFDQGVKQIYAGPAGGFGADQLSLLRRRGALGASDLAGALRWAETALAAHPASRVLLISDGVATSGVDSGEELAAAVRRLKKKGAERLDVIAAGGIRDEALLKRLTTAGLKRDGAVVDASENAVEIGRRLTETTSSGVTIAVPGATWSWPKTLNGVQAGDEAVVYAQLPADRPLKVQIGGRAAEFSALRLPAERRPLLERAWAKARIESLLAERNRADGAPPKDKLAAEIVKLSTSYRVMSPFTSLLVLETDGDYARFGIDRKALSDILSVDGGALRLAHRAPDSIPAAPKIVVATARAAKKEKASVFGGLSRILSSDISGMISGAADNLGDDGASFGGGAGGGALAAASAAAMTAGAPALPEEAHEPRVAREAAADRPAPRAVRGAAMAGAAQARALQMAAPASGATGFVPSPGVPALDRPQKGPAPYTGHFKEVMDRLEAKQADKAAAAARSWLDEEPGDVLALSALGAALEAAGKTAEAARAYGSIIDLFPARADLRRYAGARLEALKGNAGLDAALESYRKAVEQRPDHPHGHRLLAFALLKKGLHEQAFAALEAGLARRYPDGRFRGATKVLSEDLGLIAAAWIKAAPARKADILARLIKAGGIKEDAPSLRFVLNWETDGNDVDFHIFDAAGRHAFFQQMHLLSGGDLYADITTGYGPECFTIRKPRGERAGPYALQAHYYSRGPMGYGMGKLQVIEHDGQGGLTFDERPFVVMTDQAFVDLGTAR